MGLLPSNYFDKKDPTSTPATPPDASTLISPTSTLTPATPSEPTPAAPVTPQPTAPTTPEQAALNEFGNNTQNTQSDSTIGLAPKADSLGLGYQIPQALGFGLPDPDTFQKLSPADKAKAYAEGSFNAVKSFVSGVIPAIPQGIGGIAATVIEAGEGIYQGVTQSIKQGKLISPDQALQNTMPENFDGTYSKYPGVSIPLGPFGSAPSWFKTYNDAANAGASPLAASLLMFGTAVGGATILTGIAESLGNLARPKPGVTGQPVTNLEPVKQAIVNENGKTKFSPKSDSANEYYNATPAVAKQYGGNVSNIKIKLSPVGDGTMEASIVKLGPKGDTPSDFNGVNETRLFSQTLPVAPEANVAMRSGLVPLTPEEAAARGIPTPSTSDPNLIAKNLMNEQGDGTLGDKMTQKYDFTPITMKSSDINGGKLSTSDNESVSYWETKIQNGDRTPVIVVRDANGADIIDGMHKLQAYKNLGIDDIPTLAGDTKESASVAGTKNNQISFPSKPLKGTEDLPITNDQISTLDQISQVNGLSDNTKMGIVNALTGKDSIGELTNAEYVKVATQLGALDKAALYSPTMGLNSLTNMITNAIDRRDTYFNSVQDATGGQVRTGDMYNRMENARQTVKIATETNQAAIRDVYGKYWNFPNVGELVNEWKQGNESAITDNAKLSPQEKTDIISIAQKSKELQAKMGVQYNVPEENFISNYASRIQDKGGAVTQYADPNEFPSGSNFFAKQKRTGGLTGLLTDDRAIMQIYNHAGAKATFFKDPLDFAKQVYDNAPAEYQPGIKMYADRVAGRADFTEQALNKVFSENLNQKLGLNIPPDFARKVVQLGMDTTYGASLGLSPSVVLRQVISNPTFIYAEEGPGFIASALKEYFKNPSAAMDELQSRGFRIQTADPYGSAIANEDTNFGKVTNNYRRVVSASLAPLNVVDSFGRYLAMKVSDLKFNNAIDLYNAGKLSWPQTETALGLDGMSPVDANEIRQKIVAGDRDAAMQHRARVKIDDTQNPYRPATMGAVTDGAAGKAFTQFSNYAVNYTNMIRKWARYGQWDKLVRFVGSQAIVYNTMLKGYGLDYSGSMGANAAIPNPSPLDSAIINGISGMTAWKQNNQATLNNSAAAIVSQLKSVVFPGVEPARVKAFLDSYNRGPNAQGSYQVQSASGKENYPVTFSDLFWNMFGFPIADKLNAENVANNEFNASTNSTAIKSQILQMYGSGDHAGAAALSKSSGVPISPTELNSYMAAQNIPLSLRAYEQLPNYLKPQYWPQVKASLTPGQ